MNWRIRCTEKALQRARDLLDLVARTSQRRYMSADDFDSALAKRAGFYANVSRFGVPAEDARRLVAAIKGMRSMEEVKLFAAQVIVEISNAVQSRPSEECGADAEALLDQIHGNCVKFDELLGQAVAAPAAEGGSS